MREPDLRGKGFQTRFVRADVPDVVQLGEWRAWDVSPTLTDDERRRPASLGMWTLHAPGSHLFWPWTRLMVVHLRHLEGEPHAPVLHFPQATHEFLIMAIDPDQCPDPDPDSRELKYLRPSNLVHQVGGITDEMATETLRLLVRAMVNGHTSPDEDYRSANKDLIDGTLDHMRAGRHLPS